MNTTNSVRRTASAKPDINPGTPDLNVGGAAIRSENNLPDLSSLADANTAIPVPRFTPAGPQTNTPASDRPEFMYVIDKSATASSGPREHEMPQAGGVPKTYTFNHNQPEKLDYAIAVRFLQWDGFERVDEHGNAVAYRRASKRPEDLQAGEKLKLAADETVARFDELNDTALAHRAALLPGSEEVVRNGPRAAVLKFLTDFHGRHVVAPSSKDSSLELEMDEEIDAGSSVDPDFQ